MPWIGARTCGRYLLSQPQTKEEYEIRNLLGDELSHLDPGADNIAAGHPVHRIFWARGMRPFVWPEETPGTIPGEILLFIVGAGTEPIRTSIIPVPAV